MDDKLKERLLKRLQKIPKSESLETRKIALENRLTQEEVKYWFRYKDGKVYWIRSPNTKILVGTEAGCISYINKKPYRRITLHDKGYSTAKIVFLLHHGYFPKKIFYVDGNTMNTDFINIRASVDSLTSYCTNVTRSKTGYRNVYYEKRRSKYIVSLIVDKKNRFIGYYENIDDAKEAYNLAARKIYGDFAVLL